MWIGTAILIYIHPVCVTRIHLSRRYLFIGLDSLIKKEFNRFGQKYDLQNHLIQYTFLYYLIKILKFKNK